ncbi:hypothetical protein [Azospirillum sp. TSO5]|uniref:hypothetical protein n=1 Tax=Azospirillum sp. TSO5 TaxID=716760 RepID=UPI000D621748|nr:hypothetical protein [Azospirillum sp. TSO5]PWC93080.1 hypothetical protein TSO5_15435 [Azospirillum sp. TSO5]
MADNLREGERYTGLMGLVARFDLPVPKPSVISIVGSGQRRQVVEAHRTIERYLASYDYGDTPEMDLKFALRYEPGTFAPTSLTISSLRSMIVYAVSTHSALHQSCAVYALPRPQPHLGVSPTALTPLATEESAADNAPPSVIAGRPFQPHLDTCEET